MRVVRRDSLVERLKSFMERRVTVLIAPAGYGKTTLLVEWLSTSRRSNQHAVWVTCDQYDNVPSRFWAYIIAGLKKIFPQFHLQPQQIVYQEQHSDFSTLLNPLLNAIAAVPYHITLVLDDYHAITNEVIHLQLSYFIEYIPKNLHLVLSSRVKPPIPLSRLRIQRKLLEITERDLLFSLSEAQSFLTSVMNLDIDQAQAIALWNSTEGWIAGLQLAALSYSLSSQKWSPPLDVLRDNRMVLDYFSEEVLNQLSAPVQEFLLKTSILEEFSTSLCDTVLGRDDSEKLLSQIEEANLFMVCLDNGCGYRYHPLFAQVLKTRLNELYPQEVAELHLRACNWLLAHEQLDKAIAHALAAGALEKAAEIVEMCAAEALFSPNDLTRLIRWINLFSRDGDLFIQYPRLGMYYALADYYLRHWNRAESTLYELKRILESTKKPLTEADRLLQWQLSAIEAALECRTGDQKKGISNLLTVLATRPSEDHFFHGFATHELALTYEDVGELEAAANTFYEVYQYALTHNPAYALHSLCALAKTRKRQARLHEARQQYQEAFGLIDELKPDINLIAWALSGLLETTFEQNNIGQADYWASEALVFRHQLLANTSAWVWSGLALIDISLVRYYLALGSVGEAVYHFNSLTKYAPDHWVSTPNMLQRLLEVRVDIGLAMGESQIKNQLLSETEAHLKDRTERTFIEQLAQARIHWAHKRFSQARSALETLAARVRHTEERELLIKTLVLEALVHQELGEDDKALQSINDALLLAEPNRYVRTFINEGKALKYLLSRHLSNTGDESLQEYVKQLVAAFSGKSEPITDNALPETTELSVTSPDLSQRELEVLLLLTTPLSYKEIAARLTISVNTVKIHVRNIFRKLDARSRSAALERARELKLLNGGYQQPV